MIVSGVMALYRGWGGFAPQTGISSSAERLVGGLKEDGGEEGKEKVSLIHHVVGRFHFGECSERNSL